MHFDILDIVAFASVLISPYAASAHPLTSNDERNVDSREAFVEPCKEIRDQVNKWMKDNNIVPKVVDDWTFKPYIPRVPAVPIQPSLAFACLKSVPLHKDTALAQLDHMGPLFEWQSTVDYLRNPPKGYLSEGVDLLRGLDEIRKKLKENKYDAEFDFLADLHTLSSIMPRDAHFHQTSLLRSLFEFDPGVRFVSVSKDGLTTPKIYAHDDVQHVNHQYVPSPISSINGVPATQFLQELSLQVRTQDPDARFNTLFPSVAKDGRGIPEGYGAQHMLGHGLKDTTTIKFQNGTVVQYANTAYVLANFTAIASGEDLYQEYGSSSGRGIVPHPYSTHIWSERNFTISRKGFPEPYSITPGEGVRTFFPSPSDQDLKDTAVLAVNSFGRDVNPYSDTAFVDETERLINITMTFLKKAKTTNRKKLIIDLQGNGGGYEMQLTALYFTLFPPADKSNPQLPILSQVRAHPQLTWLGEYLQKQTNATSLNMLRLPFTIGSLRQPDGTLWPSFERFYGPLDGLNGGKVSQKSLLGRLDSWRYSIPYDEPIFEPKDMVILTDGNCGSACALIVAFLTHAHGVRTVTLGGRPQETPMQAVGGVKGGPVGTFDSFGNGSGINRTAIPPGLKFVPLGHPPVRVRGGVSGEYFPSSNIAINVGNVFSLGENERDKDSKIPLQFRYEAANCRLFFTWEMARDATAIWKAVRGVAWEGKRCVKGSTTNRDGTMGSDSPGYTPAVEDRFRLPKGPGSVHVGK
ncbi:hypothetical protein QBC35DRAFT_475223 [Podospora australis]|uniref:CPAF-like PDZ domain-containing protein n=1 Tax=Podospora australis TaxID=1536484 RepID=A0AAN7AGU0_9PEZI|nr:hypothetical protein QBC35DRAFT_475223 [Podospora australis]